MLTATVSGSFHRHISAIYGAVGELRTAGVDVLSPSDPRIVDHIGEFLFVASDKLRSVKLVQDRHFEAIRASDFLWVVCPDGYTGASASAEIGFAHAVKKPVFSQQLPLDVTLQHYVRRVPSISALAQAWRRRSSATVPRTATTLPQYLVDPGGLQIPIQALERMQVILEGRGKLGREEAEAEVDLTRRSVSYALDLPDPDVSPSYVNQDGPAASHI